MSVNVEFLDENCLRKCKCCLDDKELKNLWDVHHTYDGDQEIYGLMLTECFALPWQPSEDVEYICELCVSRLREAVYFKQDILATEEILANELNVKEEHGAEHMQTEVQYLSQDEYEQEQYLDQDDVIKVPEINVKEEQGAEHMQTEVQYLSQDEYEQEQYLDQDYFLKENIKNDTVQEVNIAEDVLLGEEFEQVEYLDLEEALQEKPLQLNFNIEESSQSSSLPEAPQSPKRKWPKKKKKSERTKQYKQYTQQDLKNAIEAVRSGEMTVAIAAVEYGVPKKTLTVKVNNDDVTITSDQKNEKYYKLIEEIKTILLHTTAIPFKTRTTRYYCFYCSTDGPYFEDPDELRKHTRSKHAHERTKIEIYMRPQWLYEIIKLDVDDLRCKSCDILLPDWNYLFVHYAEVHDLEFDLAYTNIIPYALDSDLKCFLCHQKFHNFGHLDSHMNNHYSNYICYECGDTFLSVSRLDKHLNVHKVGNYPCEMCEKVFTLEKYRAKHISLVHNQESTIKCLYCPKKFVGLFQRHVHVTEHHKERVKVMTCEFCGNCYTWKPYFLAHMKRKHGFEKKHKCEICNKAFLMRYELKNHMVRHTGNKKFLCGLCGESFTRMIGLNRHCQTHKEFNTVQED